MKDFHSAGKLIALFLGKTILMKVNPLHVFHILALHGVAIPIQSVKRRENLSPLPSVHLRMLIGKFVIDVLGPSL